MNIIDRRLFWVFTFCLICLSTTPFDGSAQTKQVDFFNEPFSVKYEKGIAKQINAGIDTFLTKYTTRVITERQKFWDRQFESKHAYKISVDPNRKDLRMMMGIRDTVKNVQMVTMGRAPGEAKSGKTNIVGETKHVTIYEVKWTVRKNLTSEGLLLVPKGKVKASSVVIPDADEVPEAYAGLKAGPGVALHLAEKGIKVLVPVTISRSTQYSGGDNLYPKRAWMKGSPDSQSLWSNATSREWIWRQSFVMGHSPVGMGVQKVLAAVDWLRKSSPNGAEKIGVMGYGTGGQYALYSAAIDTRIDVAWVSGYFGPRKNLWREPVCRDIWGLLTEFGDAEIASMIAPRSLVIEAAPVPTVKEPKPPKKGQENFALPGELKTPSDIQVKQEVKRLNQLFPKSSSIHPDVTLFTNVNRHGTDKALKVFTNRLGVNKGTSAYTNQSKSIVNQDTFDIQKRQKRVFDNEVQYIQNMIPTASQRRYAFLKGDFSSPKAWDQSMKPYREYFYDNIIGKIDASLLPMQPKMRQIYNKPDWKGYEVALQVWPGVYSWGILAIPKDIKPGKKRPAVVIQHGIGGLPTTALLNEKYHQVFSRLAKKGFVTFAPYNPYQFNIRKAHAVRANAFSVIIPQYQQILKFLKSRKYVDGSRIGLYGKSWGGRTALNVPVVLKDFKVSVSVAYFNKWLNKTVDNHYGHWSYFFENSIGIYNWNMGNTLTHAEIAELIAPRPFKVVNGYYDGVAYPEWVASEFEKVKRTYNMLGVGNRAQLDVWPGGHEIDVKNGGIPFLQKYLHLSVPDDQTKAQ